MEGWGGERTRYPAPGEAWERGGRAGLEEKPQGPGRWRRLQRPRGGDPRLLLRGHLGQGPLQPWAAGKAVGMPLTRP